MEYVALDKPQTRKAFSREKPLQASPKKVFQQKFDNQSNQMMQEAFYQNQALELYMSEKFRKSFGQGFSMPSTVCSGGQMRYEACHKPHLFD